MYTLFATSCVCLCTIHTHVLYLRLPISVERRNRERALGRGELRAMVSPPLTLRERTAPFLPAGYSWTPPPPPPSSRVLCIPSAVTEREYCWWDIERWRQAGTQEASRAFEQRAFWPITQRLQGPKELGEKRKKARPFLRDWSPVFAWQQGECWIWRRHRKTDPQRWTKWQWQK